MALTLTAKLAASKSGTTVQNATSSFALGDMTGDEMHQSIYVSTGTSFVTLTAASSPTIGVGSIDVSADHWVLLRNVEDTTGTWVVSFDAGTTDHINIGVGEVAGPFKMDGGKYLSVKPSVSGIRLEIVACEP
jgi:hypothetical protein